MLKTLIGLLVSVLVLTSVVIADESGAGGVETPEPTVPTTVDAEQPGVIATAEVAPAITAEADAIAEAVRIAELTLAAEETIVALRPKTDRMWANELAGLIAENIIVCEKKHGVTIDPKLAACLCVIECGFNPKANNWSTGCHGLWQVRFHVHKKTYGLKHYTDLHNPALCTRIGLDILARYIKSRGGSVEGGLRRYGTKVWGSKSRPGVMNLYQRFK